MTRGFTSAWSASSKEVQHCSLSTHESLQKMIQLFYQSSNVFPFFLMMLMRTQSIILLIVTRSRLIPSSTIPCSAFLVSSSKDLPDAVKTVLNKETGRLFGEHDPQSYNKNFLSKHNHSIPHRVAGETHSSMFQRIYEMYSSLIHGN